MVVTARSLLTFLRALKHTDLADGIHEDVSSDLARESGKQSSIMDNLAHGPGEQGTNLDSFARGSGQQGSILDNLIGSSSAMGADAKIRSNATETVGADGQARYNSASAGASSASNATEFTDSIYEDSSRRIGQTQSMTENVASKGSETISSIRDQLNTSNTSGKSDGKSIFGSSDSKSRSEMLPSSTHGSQQHHIHSTS